MMTSHSFPLAHPFLSQIWDLKKKQNLDNAFMLLQYDTKKNSSGSHRLTLGFVFNMYFITFYHQYWYNIVHI